MPVTPHHVDAAASSYVGAPFGGNNHIGPFYHGSDIYVLQYNYDAFPFHVQMYKSTDGGVTFTRQDGSNEPTLNTAALDDCMIGTTIYVGCVTDTSGFTLSMKPFSMVSDTWQTSIDGGPVALSTFGFFSSDNSYRIFLQARGSDIIAIVNQNVTGKATPHYAVYSSSAWGSAVQMGSAAGSVAELVAGVQPGGSGRNHVIYWNVTDSLFHSQCIKSDNSLATAVNVGTFYPRTGFNPWGESFGGSSYDAASGKIAVAYKNTSNLIRIATAMDADAPTWSNEAVDDALSPLTTSGGSGYQVASAFYDNGTLTCYVWNNDANNKLYQYVKTAGVWGAGTLLYSESSGQDGFCMLTAKSVGVTLAFLFERALGTYYAETPSVGIPVGPVAYTQALTAAISTWTGTVSKQTAKRFRVAPAIWTATLAKTRSVLTPGYVAATIRQIVEVLARLEG